MPMHFLRILATGILLAFSLPGAKAQQVNLYWNTGSPGFSAWVPVSPANPLPVSASVSASIAGFHPSSSLTPITATTGGVSSASFTAGQSILVQNVGSTNAAYCSPGGSATTSSQYIAPGSSALITTTSETTITCATSASTTAVNFQVGTGLWTGAGGGGGGGSGGNVTIVGPFGQALAAASVPVVLTAAQIATLTPLTTVAVTNGGTFAVQLSGATNNINNIAGTISLPTGAATSALQTTGNTTLTTINTTLGSPFQAGGSIGNASFGISGTLPAYTATPTFNLGTLNGAATAANQTNATQKTQIVDGSGNVIASTSNNLDVQCANCSGSGASAADAASFTAGTSTFAPAGGEFTSGGATACVTGHQCLVGITPARAFLTDLSSQAGTAITSAPSAYGTAPTGNVIGANVFVTNTNANGSATSANSSPVVIASDQAAVAVKAASGAIASGAIASGAVAAGAVSAGAFVSGSVLSGALASGAVVDITNMSGATAATAPTKAIENGLVGVSSEPTKVTTGQLAAAYSDLAGKQVTSPYANRENFLNCAVTITASTAATTCTGMGAQGASVKIYVTDLTCTRNDAGTTAATLTLNDSATTVIDMPNNGGGGGFSKTYNVPLQIAANTAFTVQSGTSLTSVHCSASGFKGY